MDIHRASKIQGLAKQLVEQIERLPEFRHARDRLGDRAGDDHRREVTATLVRLLREVAMAARAPSHR